MKNSKVAQILAEEGLITASYTGNPDGQPIYPVEIDHGYDQPLSGGTDIMKRVVDQFREEQGSEPREKNPRLASLKIKQKTFSDGVYTHKEKGQFEVFDGSKKLGELWKGMDGWWHTSLDGPGGVRFRKRKDAVDSFLEGMGKGQGPREFEYTNEELDRKNRRRSSEKRARSREVEAEMLGERLMALTSRTPSEHLKRVDRYYSVVHEIGMNLTRLSETTSPTFDEEERQLLVREILEGLRYIKRDHPLSVLRATLEEAEAAQSWIDGVGDLLSQYKPPKRAGYGFSEQDLEDLGFSPGERVKLRKAVNWVNRGGLRNRKELRTAWIAEGTTLEVGSYDFPRIEVLDVKTGELFTVRARELEAAT